MDLPILTRRRHRREKARLQQEIESLRTLVQDQRFTIEELKKYAWDRLERLGLMDLRTTIKGDCLIATYSLSRGMLYSMWTPTDEKRMAEYVATRLVREVIAFQVKGIGHGSSNSSGPPKDS